LTYKDLSVIFKIHRPTQFTVDCVNVKSCVWIMEWSSSMGQIYFSVNATQLVSKIMKSEKTRLRKMNKKFTFLIW